MRPVSFPVAVVVLSVVLVAGIGGAFLLGRPGDAWIVIPVVGALAGWFLVVYSRRPGPERAPAPAPPPDEPGPFDDPVELAAWFDSGQLPPSDPSELPKTPPPDVGPPTSTSPPSAAEPPAEGTGPPPPEEAP